MRPRWIVPAIVSVAVALFACGCKNDSTAPSVSFSQAEVTLWMSEIARASTGVVLSPGPIHASRGCPGGGTSSVEGSVSGTTTQTYSWTNTYSACKTASYTTDGSWLATGSADDTTMTLRTSGTLTVTASGGRSGTCALDITSVSGGTATITGTICGFSANAILRPTPSASWRTRHPPI